MKQSYIQFYLWIPQEVVGGKGKWVVDGSRAWDLAEQATENGYLGGCCCRDDACGTAAMRQRMRQLRGTLCGAAAVMLLGQELA